MDSLAALTHPGGRACFGVRAEHAICAKPQPLTIATITTLRLSLLHVMELLTESLWTCASSMSTALLHQVVHLLIHVVGGRGYFCITLIGALRHDHRNKLLHHVDV